MSFTQMLSEGVVEYLDVYEEDTVHIGTTHQEIDPSLMMGFCAATTPYSDRNPGPRNTYQAAMLKQAQSVNSLAFKDRFDTNDKCTALWTETFGEYRSRTSLQARTAHRYECYCCNYVMEVQSRRFNYNE